MAKTDFRSVDEYILTQPAEVQAVLLRVRAAIREALPDAEEGISYQIPAYRLGGKVALYFAGWKEHFSLYPASAAMLAALGEDLAGHVVSKGTIRFPLSEKVPGGLIGRIAEFRAQEARAQAAGKGGAKAAKGRGGATGGTASKR